MKAVIVYHSGYGHTKLVAETILAGMKDASRPDDQCTCIDVESASADLEQLDDADLLVMGTPTYMGGPSAKFKEFAEATSRRWLERRWAGKLAAGFTNSGGLHGDKQTTLIYLVTLASQHGMIWIPLTVPAGNPSGKHGGQPEDLNRVGASLGLMTQSDQSEPGESPSPGDLQTAKQFGADLASTASRLLRDG